jgi:hypothetical protein
MTDFDEAFLGRAANELNATLRDLKREIRELAPVVPAAPYSAEQISAAQDVIAALRMRSSCAG